jgi:hypothetical protein
MAAERLIKMIDSTFNYFEMLGKQKQDPASVEAVRKVRDQMVSDLTTLAGEPSSDELNELCRSWRSQRIAFEGPPVYAPDMFIESVCQVIELS